MSQQKLTILQILPRLNSGGVERGTIEIAAAIIKNDYNAIVISQGGRLLPDLHATGAKHITLDVASKNPFKIISNSFKLKKIIKEHNIDIIHARSRVPAWSAYLASKNMPQVKFLTTFHGVYSGKSCLKKKYNSIMLRGARIIAGSNFIINHIKNNYKFTELDKLALIHRGVDIERFNSNNVNQSRGGAYLKKWGVPSDKKIILMPARLTEWKGHEFLINGLNLLKRDDYHCLMIGDIAKHQNYKARLDDLIAQYQLQDKISIVNNIADIENIYHIAYMMVSPSLRPESFGRAIVEAGAMGKIVLATNHGGATETIIDGKTGFLCEVGDIEQLAEKINFILDLPPKELQNLSDNAVRHIEQNFSITKMQDETMNIYKSLIGNNG